MRKMFLVLLLCLFSILLIGKGEAGDLKTYCITNETASRVQTQVATTTIIPGKDVILGFRLTPFGASCVDPFVEMHDAATTASQTTTTGGTMFDALETDTGPLRSETAWYPKPKNLSLGLGVNLGGYSAVIIFYETLIAH